MRTLSGLIAGFLSGVACSIIGLQTIVETVKQIVSQF